MQLFWFQIPMTSAAENTPRVSVQDVLNCSFANWYPIFGKHSLKRWWEKTCSEKFNRKFAFLAQFYLWPTMCCNTSDRTNSICRQGWWSVQNESDESHCSSFSFSANKMMDAMRQGNNESSDDEESVSNFSPSSRFCIANRFVLFSGLTKKKPMIRRNRLNIDIDRWSESDTFVD